jgi:hypothetical protein
MPEEASLGRAMTKAELDSLNKAFLDLSAFDYRIQPEYNREYFKRVYPGFDDHVYHIMELYENGMRFKEFKSLMKKGKTPKPKPALIEIQRFKEGYSPFDGSSCMSSAY